MQHRRTLHLIAVFRPQLKTALLHAGYRLGSQKRLQGEDSIFRRLAAECIEASDQLESLMRVVSIAAIGIALGLASHAFAADMAARPYRAPPPVAAPIAPIYD